jgi:Mg-chelatase subunit ChlD
MKKIFITLLAIASFLIYAQEIKAVDIKGNDVEIILDVSGSMAGVIDGGRSKMDVAKESLATVINGMPENAFVGFRAYGHRSTSANKNCQDSELIYPISKINKDQLISKINSLNPGGWTPIDYSLQQARLDFNNNPEYGKMIILVSDGEETCGGDPCTTVKKMRDEGFNVVVNTVGFDVSGIAEEQLKCVAQATGGEYRSAKNAGELTASMTFFSQRAFEGFVNAGGTAAGTGFVNAPLVEPGTYGGDIRIGENKFYKVNAIKGQEIIAALSIKREQAMSEENSTSMCMLPTIKIYDKYQTVVGEVISDSCGSGAFAPIISGIPSGSTVPFSYKATFISDKTNEYYISIGNDWKTDCGNYSWCPEREAEKLKKDKAQYDIVIAVEGQGEAPEPKPDTTTDTSSVNNAVENSTNNVKTDAQKTNDSGFFQLSMMTLIAIVVIFVVTLIVSISITVMILKKKS